MSASLSINIIKFTNQNRSTLITMSGETCETGRCGICEKLGADVFWFNPVSRVAHSVCCEEIKTIEADLVATIDSVFSSTRDRNIAHIEAVRAVKKMLGDVSIKTYLDTYGAKRLKSIFDIIGVGGVATFLAKL